MGNGIAAAMKDPPSKRQLVEYDGGWFTLSKTTPCDDPSRKERAMPDVWQ